MSSSTASARSGRVGRRSLLPGRQGMGPDWLGTLRPAIGPGVDRSGRKAMSRLDDLIDDLTSSRISRRQFMQRAAALGLAVPTLSLLASSHILAAEGNRVRWVSP